MKPAREKHRSVIDPVFPGEGHDHGHCIDDALDRAAAICADKGARLTDVRRRVLELVWSGHRPLGAYDILDSLSVDGRKPAPPTVYRALEFLCGLGLVHRIESLNAYVGCPSPDQPHTGQFLICGDCGIAAELQDTRIDKAILAGADRAGFAVRTRTIEIEGQCSQCSKANATDTDAAAGRGKPS